MDLTLDPEQELLVQSARAFLAGRCPIAHVRAMENDARGFSPALWLEMGGLGWPGAALPAAYGGGGLTFLETALLLEEMGRVLLPSPFFASAVLSAPLLLALGSEEQRRRWLPPLAAGERIATLALVEPGWHDEWGEPGVEVRDGRVTGTKHFVPFAADADLILTVVRSEGKPPPWPSPASQGRGAGPSLVAVERGAAGVECSRLATLDAGHAYSVRFAAAPAELVGPPGGAAAALERVRLEAAVASMAYMVGAAERVLELTLDYARTRVQFGRPIGSFQAVAHRCVDMRSDLDALRYLTYQAAWASGAGAALQVSAAKAYGNEALRRIFTHAHQVYGAIGFSTECDLQLYTRRAKAAELAWGSATAHRERVARAMGL
jgi:alkylation response protein AidB-like acyl-CoA dehydrogenase